MVNMEWVHLVVRWIHVIAGIMWIGQTYLFNWMERVLIPPTDPAKKNISGELWMVHGGGFYLVEKQKWPEIMPRDGKRAALAGKENDSIGDVPRELHWFKWEAMSTWISGVLLLAIVYWMGAPLLEYGSDISQAQGIAISIGVLVGGVVVYNLLWNSPVGNFEAIGAAVSWVLIVGLTYALTKVLSNRAVYLHIGAMFGTIMVTNVWMRILPSQRKMIEITKAGRTPDQTLAARAKRCSKHNTFMSVPLIFTMISNHFPTATYGRDCNWLILGALVLAGWGAAKIIRDYL